VPAFYFFNIMLFSISLSFCKSLGLGSIVVEFGEAKEPYTLIEGPLLPPF
jgi:hypothetical protein